MTNSQVAQLKQENEKLRKALERISNLNSVEVVDDDEFKYARLMGMVEVIAKHALEY